MNHIQTTNYELNGIRLTEQNKHDYAQDLVHSLAQGDMASVQKYCQNKKVSQSLKDAFEANREAVIELIGSQRLDHSPIQKAVTDEKLKADRTIHRFFEDYYKQNTALNLLKELSDISKDKELSKLAFEARKEMAFKFSAKEYALEQKSDSPVSLLNQNINKLSAIESRKHFEKENPEDRRLALKVVAHIDAKLNPQSHIKQGDRNIDVRWWDNERSLYAQALKQDVRESLDQISKPDYKLNRLSARYDMVETGMPKGFHKKLQDASFVMTIAHQKGRDDVYEASLGSLRKLGEVAREFAYSANKKDPNNLVMEQTLQELRSVSLDMTERSPDSRTARIQADLANSLMDGFESHDVDLALDLSSDDPAGQLRPVVADAMADQVLKAPAPGPSAAKPPQWMLDKYMPAYQGLQERRQKQAIEEDTSPAMDHKNKLKLHNADDLAAERQKHQRRKMAEDMRMVSNIEATLGIKVAPGDGSIDQRKAAALSMMSSLPDAKNRMREISRSPKMTDREVTLATIHAIKQPDLGSPGKQSRAVSEPSPSPSLSM